MQTMLANATKTLLTAFVAQSLAWGCSAPNLSLSQADPAPTAAVELLDGGQDVVADKLVLTIGTVLSPAYQDSDGSSKTFTATVVKIAQAKYVGYQLASVQDAAGKFAFTGPLQGFIARYTQTVTALWTNSGQTPDHPNFATDDLRAVVGGLTRLTPPEGTAGRETLRIYRTLARTAYAAGAYVLQPGLTLFYIDPATGKRQTFIFAPTATQYDLYSPVAGRRPLAADDNAINNVIAAADTMVAVSPTPPNLLPVPFHTYVAACYRVVDGTSFQGSATPYGPALVIPGLSAADVRGRLTPLLTLAAAVDGSLDAATFASLLDIVARLPH